MIKAKTKHPFFKKAKKKVNAPFPLNLSFRLGKKGVQGLNQIEKTGVSI